MAAEGANLHFKYSCNNRYKQRNTKFIKTTVFNGNNIILSFACIHICNLTLCKYPIIQ